VLFIAVATRTNFLLRCSNGRLSAGWRKRSFEYRTRKSGACSGSQGLNHRLNTVTLPVQSHSCQGPEIIMREIDFPFLSFFASFLPLFLRFRSFLPFLFLFSRSRPFPFSFPKSSSVERCKFSSGVRGGAPHHKGIFAHFKLRNCDNFPSLPYKIMCNRQISKMREIKL